MSARIALRTLVLAVLTAFTLVRPAAAGPWGLAPGEWHANMEGSTFTANTFHGEVFRADTGLVVEERALRTVLEVGWKKRLSLVFGLPLLSVTRRDARVQGSATGFQDVLVGIRYNLIDGRDAVAVELDWSAPAGYNRNLDSLGLQLGDGHQQLTVAVAGGGSVPGRRFIQWSLAHSYRYLTITKKDGSLVVIDRLHPARYLWTQHLLASADLGFWVSPSVLVGGRFRGKMSIGSGLLAEASDASLLGAQLLYRVDERLDMFAGFWSTASGRNTLHYDQVYLGLGFHRTKLNRLEGFLGGSQSP